MPEVKRTVADAGYYSESDVDACEEADITPFIAPGRMPHNRDFAEECTEPETAGINVYYYGRGWDDDTIIFSVGTR
ncbi:MAG: hypothetical protein LBI74_09890 [Synergistaceae bacterium]|nr:hypothetical protein [Synergistaceae bacterium]